MGQSLTCASLVRMLPVPFLCNLSQSVYILLRLVILPIPRLSTTDYHSNMSVHYSNVTTLMLYKYISSQTGSKQACLNFEQGRKVVLIANIAFGINPTLFVSVGDGIP